jgi:hypothetical protein
LGRYPGPIAQQDMRKLCSARTHPLKGLRKMAGHFLWFRRVLLFAGVCVLFILFFLVVSLSYLLHRPVHVTDRFEEPRLSSVWISLAMVPGAFSTQSEIVHSGHHAAQITLRANDRFEAASYKGAANERDELVESPLLWSQTGKTYEYAFSLYLPKDFPIVQTRLVIAQWKQVCEGWDCHPSNPVLAIRYVGGVLFITRKNDADQITLYRSQGEMRGQWLSFRFVTRFSQQEEGIINGWLNGRQIIQYQGVTAYRAAKAYPAYGFFYFKMGLYRDLMKESMTIYLDDFRKDRHETAALGENSPQSNMP